MESDETKNQNGANTEDGEDFQAPLSEQRREPTESGTVQTDLDIVFQLHGEDLQALLSEQLREPTGSGTVESDLDIAFQLQMQEAINVSLYSNKDVSLYSNADVLLPSSSSHIVFDSDDFTVSGLFAKDTGDYDQQFLDQQKAAAEILKIQRDLNRSIHDHAFARELQNLPEEEWKEKGDNIHKPYQEGSILGGGVALSHEDSFRVHVKGLIREEEDELEKKTVHLAGIGVAICDMNDELVLEVSKGVIGGEISVEASEMKAVIEGLNVAIMLGIKRIVILSSSNFTYQCVIGQNRPKESYLATMFDQVTVISRKLDYFGAYLVQENQLKFVVELARVALQSQAKLALRNDDHGKNVIETCAICLENISIDHMFEIDGCLHRFCFSCMRTYVQVKLLQSRLPKCPHDGCKSELKVDDCKKFLTSELFDILNQRIVEASIDPSDKIYCPYPPCSALMLRSETPGTSGGIRASVRECTKCHKLFCIDCKVPWHDNMTCLTYKQQNPPPPEDTELKSLATKSLWRQCPKCSHMVSLGEGCNHIYCRCGHEFCYVCGAEWKNKKATCGCPLWDEHNIIYNG